ncbi:MAG: endolytic transglycosylase MltG [Gammaproteobacteria bacterium]|jgi:UPF0755 protein
MIKRIFMALVMLLLTFGAATWWLWQDMQRTLQQPVNLSKPFVYSIEPGMSLRAVSEDLAANGILDNPYYLNFAGRRQGIAHKLKTGEYEIIPGTTALQLLEQFVAGKVVQYTLTLLEGWTFEQIMEAVMNSDRLVHTLPPAIGSQQLMLSIGYPDIVAEGQFFPDTYHFPVGTTDLEFLRRAFHLLSRVLDEEWQRRAANLPYKTPYDALIMASIIEKETGRTDEREKIAGVFVRRLRQGMKLQTDPTVIYAMGARYNGNIKHKDLEIDSPYNTYRNRGLPPTPIALAGRGSINAALHPEDGKALYFVSRGDGSHYFSSTLNEHNKAVAKYQLEK